MKTVIEMARIAGARDDGQRFEFELRDLEFLAELVRADEREACANECDEWIKNGSTYECLKRAAVPAFHKIRLHGRHPSKGQHMKIAWIFIIVMLTLLTIRSIYA